MSMRLSAATAAVLLGAGLVTCSTQSEALAAPAATSVGTGPCASDLDKTHAPLIGKDLEVPIPYPWIETVPYPAPEESTTRIPQAPLPANTCENPCPDLTDKPKPGGLSADLNLPKLRLNPQPFIFGIPVPGPGAPKPPKPPEIHPPSDPAPRTAAPATPRIGAVTEVSKQTGAGSINRTDKRWQVQGTDLGIMWESAPGEIATAFGDTIGSDFHPPGGMGDDWRSNVLAFSTDHDLSDGVTYNSFVQDSRCHAAELLSSRKKDNVEITTIPTSGFAIGNRQYMSYMSIRTWNSIPGTFWTNYGGIAYSDDHGQTWTKDEYAKWDNLFGLAKFQVTAMVPQGDFVYMFGTANTRLGDIALARVPKADVLNKSAYQYWKDGNWVPVSDPTNEPTPIVHAPAGELSARFDEERQVWQLSYLDTAKAAITLREAKSPQGNWSDGAKLVGVDTFPEIYGGFIHPWSHGSDLYFNISTWSDYNVYMMKAKLEN